MLAIKSGLLAEFDHEMGATRRLLERLPEDRLGWKPHDRSMSLGGLGTHLASIPHWGEAILESGSFDLAQAPPPNVEKTSRGAILEAFDSATNVTRALMDKTDHEYLAPWVLKRGTQEVFAMPRVSAFRTFVINHVIHHRGQLTVYLRLNNVPVPAIYGPSADEG